MLNDDVIIIPLPVDESLLTHNLVYNGVSIRAQKIRPEDYIKWLTDQPVDKWLQSIRDEFQTLIPFDQPLYICVNWLQAKTFKKPEKPSLNKTGELRMYEDGGRLVKRGKSTERISGGLSRNAKENIPVFQQDLFYRPYVPLRTPDFDWTTEDGVDIKVTKIEMVEGTELIPNHQWSQCIIQSADRKTTYFSDTKEKSQTTIPEKKKEKHTTRTGFEDFQAIMRDGGLSDSFTTQMYKLRPDGTPITQDGKSVVHETVVRFRIASVQHTKDKVENTKDGLQSTFKGSQYNNSVDKTNRIWLDVYNKDGTWSGKPILLGNAHFSSMAAIYDCVEVDDSLADNYKTTVRQRGKHILALIRKQEDKTREIQKACRSFDQCNLVYQNDVLSSVNGKGELKPMFRRVVKTYTPVVKIQHNGDDSDLKQLKQYDEIIKHCTKWLEKNHEQWLALDISQKKSKTKEKSDNYALSESLVFMAKQTVRWGSPVFTDTVEKQPVTFDIIKKQLEPIVLGTLGDIEPTTWHAMRHQLLKLFG